MLFVVVALLLAKVDSTQIAAGGSALLALAALIKSVTSDPRAARLSERQENAALRREVDEQYRRTREVEDREREANRRLDKAERGLEAAEIRIARLTGELDGANARIRELENDVRKWRMIAGDIRGNR